MRGGVLKYVVRCDRFLVKRRKAINNRRSVRYVERHRRMVPCIDGRKDAYKHLDRCVYTTPITLMGRIQLFFSMNEGEKNPTDDPETPV